MDNISITTSNRSGHLHGDPGTVCAASCAFGFHWTQKKDRLVTGPFVVDFNGPLLERNPPQAVILRDSFFKLHEVKGIDQGQRHRLRLFRNKVFQFQV